MRRTMTIAASCGDAHHPSLMQGAVPHTKSTIRTCTPARRIAASHSVLQRLLFQALSLPALLNLHPHVLLLLLLLV